MQFLCQPLYTEKIISPSVKAENDAMAELDRSGEDVAELIRLTALFSNQIHKEFRELREC